MAGEEGLRPGPVGPHDPLGAPEEGEAALPPVDRAHLARFTCGDEALEREVLELFCTQSLTYLAQLRAATSLRDSFAAAHSLKGTARAVGAWRMARAAEDVEALREDSPPDMRAAQIGELEASLQEASAFVASLGGTPGEDQGK